MIRALSTAGRTTALALLLAATGSAYYHFVHYATQDGAYVPVRERFDLASLPNQTVNFYVAESGPARFATGDSFAALLSQLRFAARTWSSVGSSSLRVGYGGLFSAGAPQSIPHIEVVFDELPPGVLAYGSPTVRADVATGPAGSFVPILTSVIVLNTDLSASPSQNSLTLVHEMGHALGLQHTFTSSTMSTKDIRATTKAKPLATDDIAGISLLYPSAKFASQTGSISGQVSMAGSGVAMASVVALTPSGQAVSTLANPDGSYRIDGLPQDQYYVYAHTLPPGADIVLPLDADGNPIPAGEAFRTQFYPGTTDPAEAQIVMVSAGADVPGVNFDVERSGAPQLYGVSTYSYAGSRDIGKAFLNSAFVNTNGASRLLVATGTGLMPNGQLAPGLSMSILGNLVHVNSVARYTDYYLLARFGFDLFSQPGPRHLVFSTGGETYVRPAGLNLVQAPPPTILSIAPSTDTLGKVSIIGTNFGPDTQILFDGLPAAVSSFDGPTGTIVATPPPGASGYRANVVAVNTGDGQTSQFAQDPVLYAYDPSAPASINLSMASLPAGAEALMDVFAFNTNFVEGETQLGFGSSGVVVKRLWVLAPNQLRAEVAVPAAAPAGSALVTVTTGFQVIAQAVPFHILPANPFALSASSDLVNPLTNQNVVYPGSLAALGVIHLPAGATPSITLGETAVRIVSVTDGQIVFEIPASIEPGPAILRLQAGPGAAYPIMVVIEKAPPSILSVWRSTTPIDATTSPAHPGDLLTIVVSGLTDPGVTVAPERLRVTVGGIDHQPVYPAQPSSDLSGHHQIQFLLDPNVQAGSQPLTVTMDNRTSAVFALPVKTP